jgi:hypothetical protein
MAGVESLARSKSGRAEPAVGVAGMAGAEEEAAATGRAGGTPPSGPGKTAPPIERDAPSSDKHM